MELDLEKVVTNLKKATDDKFPIFKDDVEKDELKGLDSYFIYKPYGRMSKTGKGEYSQEFYLAFITTEGIDFFSTYIFKVIHQMKLAKLIFDESDYDQGNLKNTGETAEIFTLDFHRQLKCMTGTWSYG